MPAWTGELHRGEGNRDPGEVTGSQPIVLADRHDAAPDPAVVQTTHQRRSHNLSCGRGAVGIVNDGLHNRRRSDRPGTSEQFRSSLPVMRIRPIPFHQGQEEGWRTVLQSYDDNLQFNNHQTGALLELEEELHERTGGCRDTLDQLICQTALQVIEDDSPGFRLGTSSVYSTPLGAATAKAWPCKSPTPLRASRSSTSSRCPTLRAPRGRPPSPGRGQPRR